MSCLLVYHDASVGATPSPNPPSFYTTSQCNCLSPGAGGCCYQEVLQILQSRGVVGGWAQLSLTTTTRNLACGQTGTSFVKSFPLPGPGTYKAILKITDCSGTLVHQCPDFQYTFS